MRFYVPNMEEPEEKEGDKDEEKMKDEGKDDEEDEEEEVTPAKILNDQILKYAGLGDSARDIIASFHEIPL